MNYSIGVTMGRFKNLKRELFSRITEELDIRKYHREY